MTDSISNKNIFELIKNYWFIVAFIGSIIVGYVQLKSDVADHNIRIVELKARVDNQGDIQNSVNIKLQEIITTLEFIKEKVK